MESAESQFIMHVFDNDVLSATCAEKTLLTEVTAKYAARDRIRLTATNIRKCSYFLERHITTE